MNFLKLTMIDTPSPRDADASKKLHFFPNFWPLSNTNGTSLPYDRKLTKSLLIPPPSFAWGGGEITKISL